jgi:hypothetical protein
MNRTLHGWDEEDVRGLGVRGGWPGTTFSFPLTIAVLVAGHSAVADEAVHLGATDVKSVFFIAKSENRNQVHYGVRLDASCNPVTNHPVYGYWRMFESRGELEPILDRENPAYGVDEAQEISRNSESTRIRIKLRAFPDRSLVVTVKRLDGQCEARAITHIAGADAQLGSIYVRLKWPFGIDYLLLQGSRTSDGRWVKEKVQG